MRRDLAARGERAVDAARLLVRSALDTNPVPDWDHVTKVDPEGAKKLPLLYPLWLAETDAVSVGGSADVTPANTEAAFDLLAPLSTPVCHEPSGAEHVTERSQETADLLLVPEVLNGDSEALVGTLGVAIESVREVLAPQLVGRKAPWLPDRVAFREKKAVQYGSLVSRELDRLARQNGFKRRMDDHVTQYVESLTR